MFKSFFPKPGTFFLSAFVWALIAVIFWQAGGGDWVARITGASGQIPISAARFWSLMGTGLLAVVGIKLPGLEFKNQRVEAAYRKELVYGEDDATRATPPTVRELFSAVRKNYFRLYFHYMYFNIARILYLQVDNVFGLFLLFPSIVAGTITLGLMTQITNVFGQVRGAFQYLINSWTTLVELMSIYKRLRSFEHELDGDKIQEVTHTLS
ncbi:hypothetical protein RSZ19_002624 [Escherichia coli]|nr:sbmA/BacA-like family protein [Escherichia coli]EET3921901.1 sbmA/BacA-like family protein [Escherichia coli]EHM4982244.1 hypothetical protein [Escherichia coli]EHO2527182.1 hypothetical protein [Escherichia coli]EJQ2097680.1 hypothetical protein [Escherichia coli]